jgi:hypothetical protein
VWQVIDQCSKILRQLEASGGGVSYHSSVPVLSRVLAERGGDWEKYDKYRWRKKRSESQ